MTTDDDPELVLLDISALTDGDSWVRPPGTTQIRVLMRGGSANGPAGYVLVASYGPKETHDQP